MEYKDAGCKLLGFIQKIPSRLCDWKVLGKLTVQLVRDFLDVKIDKYIVYCAEQ